MPYIMPMANQRNVNSGIGRRLDPAHPVSRKQSSAATAGHTGPIRALVVAGARPNFMKVAPLLRAMRERADFAPFLVHTGQHYDAAMSESFFRDLGIPEPDVNLGVGSGSHAEQTAQVLVKIEQLLLERRPELVLVSSERERQLGAEQEAEFLAELGRSDHAATSRWVESIGARLASHSFARSICAPVST